jgi:hypothetical protein
LSKGQSLMIHQIQLWRTNIPDITLFMLNSAAPLPTMAYISLIVINHSIKTLEHQNNRI